MKISTLFHSKACFLVWFKRKYLLPMGHTAGTLLDLHTVHTFGILCMKINYFIRDHMVILNVCIITQTCRNTNTVGLNTNANVKKASANSQFSRSSIAESSVCVSTSRSTFTITTHFPKPTQTRIIIMHVGAEARDIFCIHMLFWFWMFKCVTSFSWTESVCFPIETHNMLMFVFIFNF